MVPMPRYSPTEAEVDRDAGALAGLEALRRAGGPVLLCLGGSTLTALRTPTSDTDFFAIGAPRALSIARRIVSGLPKTDLEIRELPWLERLGEQLQAYHPPVHGGASPFAFVDLRFLARVLRGHAVVDEGGLLARIEPLREPLRRALATYLSSSYIVVYEDAVGLLLAGRYDEIPTIAGELAQRACLLALLQTQLVEPSPKWALSLAASAEDRRLRAGASRLNALVGAYDAAAPRAWAESLLRLCNAVVAVGCLRAMRGVGSGAWPAAPDTGEFQPEWCLMGVPSHQTLLDTRTNRVLVWNIPWLMRLAAWVEVA